jgi:steroid delta-isomerase-like uncharacterized protein
MSSQNKEVSNQLTYEVWNSGNIDLIDEILSDDFVFHRAPPGLSNDREGFKQFVAMYRNAFPDVKFEVQSIIVEGDAVMSRWKASGTHTGEMMGIPPTGKKVTVTGMTENRIEAGKITTQWNEFDDLGMLQQVGAMPPPE